MSTKTIRQGFIQKYGLDHHLQLPEKRTHAINELLSIIEEREQKGLALEEENRQAFLEKQAFIQKNSNLLGAEKIFFEKHLEAYDEKIRSIVERKKKNNEELSSLMRQKMMIRKAQTGRFVAYPFIDLSFLQQTKKTCISLDYSTLNLPLPIFAVYPVEQPLCSMTIRFPKWYNASSTYSKSLAKVTTSISSPLINQHFFFPIAELKSAKTVGTIAAAFAGFIPEESRNTIREMQKIFGKNNVYLIAEAEWKTEIKKLDAKLSPIENLLRHIAILNDPIIIGIDEKNSLAYYGGDFDCTPAENMAKDLFVGNKRKN